MDRHFNPYSTANTIRMLKTQIKGSFLLVEGDTDSRFFSNLTDSSYCKIIPTFGKANVIKTIELLEKSGTQGVLGVVDADYWILEGWKPGTNLIVTDTHDLETMIIMSPALEKVLREYIPGDKMDCIQKLGQSIRQALLQAGLPVGCLRWVSFKEKFELNFDSLPFEQFLNPNTLVVDLKRMVRSVRVVSKNNISLKDSEYLEKINALLENKANAWHICQGHDLIFILELIIPVIMEKLVGRNIASEARKKIRAISIDRDLRLAYEPAFFVTTQMYISMKEWENFNKPYKILVI